MTPNRATWAASTYMRKPSRPASGISYRRANSSSTPNWTEYCTFGLSGDRLPHIWTSAMMAHRKMTPDYMGMSAQLLDALRIWTPMPFAVQHTRGAVNHME
ncbi:hypothetical protein BN1723_015480 [Verticillium longisporum]|uniref:Uncharacterized protein n=1 Tax=Verticillium longisporum TaxID=100787 RepID=A0A0G4MZI1_VERLO|nr:hypothetical protein BN1723_015480 [Verticillium longisporum]